MTTFITLTHRLGPGVSLITTNPAAELRRARIWAVSACRVNTASVNIMSTRRGPRDALSLRVKRSATAKKVEDVSLEGESCFFHPFSTKSANLSEVSLRLAGFVHMEIKVNLDNASK